MTSSRCFNYSFVSITWKFNPSKPVMLYERLRRSSSIGKMVLFVCICDSWKNASLILDSWNYFLLSVFKVSALPLVYGFLGLMSTETQTIVKSVLCWLPVTLFSEATIQWFSGEKQSALVYECTESLHLLTFPCSLTLW